MNRRAARRHGLLAALGRSPVTITLIAICVLVWTGQLLWPGFANLVPLLPADLPRYPWTLITSMFAHFDQWPLGLLHIGVNMWALAILGPGLEQFMGRRLFALSYLVGGLGAGVGYVLLAAPPGTGARWQQVWWDTAVVGASGALFALFGMVYWARRALRMSVGPVYIVVGINLVIGFVIPGIAWTEHLSGLVVGFGLGYLMVRARSAGRPAWFAAWLVVIAVALGVAVTVSYVLRPG